MPGISLAKPLLLRTLRPPRAPRDGVRKLPGLAVPTPRPGRRWCALTAGLLVLVACTPAFATAQDIAEPAPAPQVRLLVPAADSPVPAPEGHVLVTWEIPGAAPDDLATFEIEYGERADFSDAVRRNVGVDRASFLSGLPDGPTHVRVRAVAEGATPGAWSEPGVIQVQYPGASLVRNLMLLGAATLLVLLGVIARGHLWALRQERSVETADVR